MVDIVHHQASPVSGAHNPMPRPSTFPLPARGAFDVPAYKQLADALIYDIRRGRLLPGAKLHSTRALAESAGVHRNTAVAAYDELLAQGFVEAHARRGTFVSAAAPVTHLSTRSAPRERSAAPGFSLIAPPVDTSRVSVPDGVLNLGGGMPDDRLAPITELSRAPIAGCSSAGDNHSCATAIPGASRGSSPPSADCWPRAGG